MEDGLRVLGVVVVTACALSFVGSTLYRRWVLATFQTRFAQQDIDGCVRLLGSLSARLLLPRYNRLFMLLNVEECLDDADAACSLIDEMLGLRVTCEQRRALLLRAFDFFIGQREYERAKGMLEELRKERSAIPPETLETCERTYDIFAHKSSAYLKEMRTQLERAKGEARISLLYLLSVQYENKGEASRAQTCLDQIKADLEEEGN